MRQTLRSIGVHVENTTRETTGTIVDAEDGTAPLMRALYASDKAHTQDRYGTGLAHVSSVLRMPACARAYYITRELALQGVEFSAPIFGSMRLTWAYGRAAEKHVRDTWLQNPSIRKTAYGVWECLCKKTRHTGHLDPSAPTCPHCKTKQNRYAEISLLDKKLGVSGNPDFINWEDTAYRVVEIKSIRGLDAGADEPQSKTFKNLDAPLINHVEQPTHYINLLRRKGKKVHRKPMVLYVSKYFEQRQWYKSFLPTDAVTERAEDTIAEQTSATSEYAAATVCPEKDPVCVEDPNARKKSCPAWVECMARGTECGI